MNGIDYTFRVINVTPKNQKCNLYKSGGIALTNKNKLIAATTSFLSSAAGIIYGNVPYLGLGISIFEAISDINSSIQTTSVISDMRTVYSWNVTEMCSYIYLALNTGAYLLIGHYNMGNYYIGTITNTLKFENDLPVSDGIFNEFRGEFRAEDYASGYTALKDYVKGEAFTYNVMSSFSIYGIEGQKVATIKLLNPYTPGEIR